MNDLGREFIRGLIFGGLISIGLSMMVYGISQHTKSSLPEKQGLERCATCHNAAKQAFHP